MKIADSVWLSLCMSDNEKVQHISRPLAPAWAVLNSQHLIVLASMIPKDLNETYMLILKTNRNVYNTVYL
jgi:hypothetical protein